MEVLLKTSLPLLKLVSNLNIPLNWRNDVNFTIYLIYFLIQISISFFYHLVNQGLRLDYYLTREHLFLSYLS